ncbi:MAG: aspartate aminotransferase family protein [Vicinamibacterales bacterium]
MNERDFAALSFEGAPSILVAPPGPGSRELLEFQREHEGSAVSYPRGLPMAVQRARGATVEDVDGNLYIDFFGGAGVMAVGHGNPEVTEAAIAQLRQLTHALDLPNPARRSLVERLLSVLPSELGRLFFGGPTGSDAVELAIKIAKFNTRRQSVVAFEGSYHGMTAGALSLSSGRSFKAGLGALLPDVHFAPYPYCYRCAFGRTREDCSLECAGYLDRMLDDPHSGVSEPAAVIVEPIQGEGGSIVPPLQFMARVREACDRHGAVLVADEIQAGFCRTGKMFAFEHSGVVPDVVTMSKALGGIGLPISGIAYREKFNTMPPGLHIGTFRGNVAAYAAGAAAIDFMVTRDLAGHAASVGRDMLSALAPVHAESEIVGDVRGAGLMLGVEFVTDRATKEPAPGLASAVRTACHRRGVLFEIGGHYSNVARFLPPLVITRELALRGVDVFAEAVREVERSR